MLLCQGRDQARPIFDIIGGAGSAEADLMGRLMARLLAAGFRYSHVERDGATPEHGFTPAGPASHRDLIWFNQDL